MVIREFPPGRYAVLRFKGGRSTSSEQTVLAQLKSWMAEKNLVSSSKPTFGYFDPPWTPSFLSRNEVMLKLD